MLSLSGLIEPIGGILPSSGIFSMDALHCHYLDIPKTQYDEISFLANFLKLRYLFFRRFGQFVNVYILWGVYWEIGWFPKTKIVHLFEPSHCA